jgi:ribosomal RNA-processing protein 8
MATNPEIRKEWEATLEKYKEYLCDDNIANWRENNVKLKAYMDAKKKPPSTTDKDSQVKTLGKWTSHQKTNYAKNIHIMATNLEIRKEWEATLEKYKEYLCVDNVANWRENNVKLKAYMDAEKKLPSDKDKDSRVKTLGQWISTQKKNYPKNIRIMATNPEIRKEWEETLKKYKEYLKQDICEIPSEPVEGPSNNIDASTLPAQHASAITVANKTNASRPTPKKSMKLNVPPTSQPVETTEHKRNRVKSKLSVLHQRYKTLTSQNLGKEFTENPDLWHTYHATSEENEKSFPEDEIPRNRIIHELNKIQTKRPKVVVDMGCGNAQISQHYKNDHRFQFINYDHISSNDSVTSCDISRTPLDDNSVEICILSLAMWGHNCKEYITEASRILETNGELYIIEPTKRWTEEDEHKNIIPGKAGDLLKTELEKNGFHIKKPYVKKSYIEKFCLFVCSKLA